jgi:uncharacterized damage-inducible protein DinB
LIPEIKNYLNRLEDLRGQVLDLIRDLPAEALNWRPVEGEDDHITNSLAVLAAHIAGAEQFWIHEVIGGYPKARDRDQEFLTAVEDAREIIAKHMENKRRTQEILEKMDSPQLDKTHQVREKEVPARWGILHIIDHTSLHLGHMQITFQLWNKGQGADAPRWFQRI